ncbi:MAG: amino acid permease [bacterium]|nr:amino acid permease [bacterium]
MIRRLGTTDAVLIVMGGILGSGIFLNPALVVGYLHAPALATIAWIAGGIIALLGAALFAELAARRPENGGFYAYLRDAFHPSIAFIYGWTLLLVAQSGGMAAGAVTFAIYVVPALHLPIGTGVLGAIIIAAFTLVNCFGVRQGAFTQHLFMLLNVAMILVVAVCAVLAHGHVATTAAPTLAPLTNGQLLAASGLALVAVLFAYDGWHTSSFINAELKDPARTLPRAITLGVVLVVGLYLLANWAFLHGLGAAALAHSQTPASDLAALALGPLGAGIVTALVAIATMSTLSQQILVSPRVYYQMAEDRTFFRFLGYVHPRTHVPIFAILAQGVTAATVALSGSYNQILNYVESVDFVFFGLAAIALFIFRKRDGDRPVSFRVPLHPWSTGLFLVIAWGIVADVALGSPRDTVVGLGIMLLGLPVYWVFASGRRKGAA